MTGETVNIPALQNLNQVGEILYWGEKSICFNTSEVAHQYFAINNDCTGLYRRNLTQEIQKYLFKNQKAWERIWEDPLCLKYKRQDHQDFWLWNHLFFNAPINDLEYIVKLIERK